MLFGRTRAFALVFAVLCAFPAHAGESWVCAYPGLTGATVINRYTVNGGVLVDANFGTQHKILQNNDLSVVAAWSISEVERGNNWPSIGARVLIISKKDGAFRMFNAFVGETNETTGKCTQ